MKCPNCYTELPDTATFCYMCKKTIPTGNKEVEKQPCPNCGAPLPKTATECYVCHKKLSVGYSSSVIEKENSNVLIGKPYTRLPQNSAGTVPRYKAKPPKNGNGCIVNVGGTFLIIVIILGLFFKYGYKKENEETSEDRTEIRNEITDNTTEKTTQENKSPLDQKLASDMKNMKVGEVGKKGKVYLGLAYVKRSNEMHYLKSTDYTDADHDILYFFVDIYNNSDDIKSISAYNFSCYIDGTQVDHFDCNFLFTEDGISEYNSNDIDSGCARLLALDYEVPKDWNEAKLYYGSECVWVVKNSDVSDEAYNGQTVINAVYTYQNTPIGKSIYSGDYEIVFDGFEYYIPEGYYKNDIYAVFKFTINAKNDVDWSLLGYNMRCYHNNYLTDDSTFLMDEKIDDYINVYDVDEIHEGMSAKIYIAFEVDEKGGDFRMIFDEGYLSDKIIANVFVVGTDSDGE